MFNEDVVTVSFRLSGNAKHEKRIMCEMFGDVLLFEMFVYERKKENQRKKETISRKLTGVREVATQSSPYA